MDSTRGLGVIHNVSHPLLKTLVTRQALPMSQRSDLAVIVRVGTG